MLDLYDDAQVLRANPLFVQLKQVFLKGVVARPSTVSGKDYPRVSEAYFKAVHSVLTKEKSAERAAVDLETELVRITGFKVRPSVPQMSPSRDPRSGR
jgi:trehalose/maltose transport system substrate-binding protein